MLYIDFGVAMAGGLNGVGLRAVELATALAEHTDVTVLSPDRPDEEITSIWPSVRYQRSARVQPTQHDIFWYGFATPLRTIARFRAAQASCVFDAIVWPLEFLTYQNVRTAADPEHAYQAHLRDYKRRLRLADRYTVASTVERHVVTGMLSAAGWSPLHRLAPSLDEAFCLIPVGASAVNENSRARSSTATPGVPTLVWNGGTWNHYDPTAAVEAVTALNQDGIEVQLRFLYPQRGTPTASLASARRAAEGNPAIRFETNLGLVDRVEALRKATASICVYPDNALWDLCPPMRLRETLIYQLPIIAPRRGALGDLIATHGFGVTTEGTGLTQITDAILALLDEETSRRARHAAAVAAPTYFYESVATQVWAWLQHRGTP